MARGIRAPEALWNRSVQPDLSHHGLRRTLYVVRKLQLLFSFNKGSRQCRHTAFTVSLRKNKCDSNMTHVE
jgi:hypothetical protein